MTGPDLHALAAELEAALWERLRRAGWAGSIHTVPWPASGGIMVELTPAAGPDGQVLVPVEALTDRAAFPGVVEHLAAPFVQPQPRRVNAYVGRVIERFYPGHPDHGFEYRTESGAYGGAAAAIGVALDMYPASATPVVRVVDVDTREEWYVRP